MSIQIGTTNLTNYRTFGDPLYLTTTSNGPLIHLDSTHPSQNVLIRTDEYYWGQSNNRLYMGMGSNRPILEYTPNGSNLIFHSNVLASNVLGTFQRLTATQTLNAPTTITSNQTIYYTTALSAPAALTVRNPDSNLFVVQGYDNTAYFTGRLGVGTAPLIPTIALQAPTANLQTLLIDTLGFNATPGVVMSNLLGSTHLTRPTVFEANVDIVGSLSAASFDIADLSTNRGVFRSNVIINDRLAIVHTSNNGPTVSVERNYLASNAAMFSNVASLYPFLTAGYRTNSNTSTVSTTFLTIDPTGKIGIGTDTPQKTLELRYAPTYTNLVSNTGLLGIYGSNSATDFITVSSNAFIGIGTERPQCYLDWMIPSSNAFRSNAAPGYLYIHSNTTPVLFMDSNGHIGINTTTTRSNASVYIDGVLECEYLSPHRFTTPDDSPNINFSQCNIANINTISASNIQITQIYASNIYCDLISASNYDLLAFNSYLATKEIELELDDLIYSGNNAFIVARNYPLYFDRIGASNPQGGLDGTTDSNLENKPTDHVSHPWFGRIHIISDSTSNSVSLGDGRRYNNAILATSSNMFSGVDCNVAVFLQTQGSNGSGYAFGLTSSNITTNDSLCRLSLDPYPYDDTLTPLTTYGYDTFTFAMEPYGGATRRIGLRYNYTQNTLQIPKMYISGADISQVITTAELNSMSGYTVYSRGNIKADASGASTTLYSARADGSGNITFAIGSSLAAPNQYYLDVNGRAIVRNDLQVVGKVYANSVISQTSDRRLKNRLSVIEDPLEKIKTLTGYTFNRLDLPDAPREAGLIAQEVQAILPEVVHQNTEGFYSIAYGNLAGLFVESIKSLESRILSLETELALLRRG
jgi:Chaperone of endosialidase